eukprot:360472-Chlamydomonas_euryale.AAC.1
MDGASRMLRDAGLDVWHVYTDGDATGVLVGNSAAIWRPFSEWTERPSGGGSSGDGDGERVENPLDTYVESAVAHAVEALRSNGSEVSVAWAHRVGELDAVSTAVGSGAAARPPGVPFALHPRFGPWWAIRARLLLRGLRPAVLSPVAAPLPEALSDMTWADVAGMARAARTREDWLAVRRACAAASGTSAEEYPPAMLLFHYSWLAQQAGTE